MARYIKQFDPEEKHRRIAVDIQEAHCPGLLEFLSTLPFGHEGPGLRAIVYQWFLAREADGTLHGAFGAVVCGPGGLSGPRLPKTKSQAKTRASTRPAVQAVRSKRAPQAAPEVAEQAPRTSVQELPPPIHAPRIVHTQSTSDTPVQLPQPREPAGASSALTVPAPTLAPSLEDDSKVDLDKATPAQLEALMGLETMFN